MMRFGLMLGALCALLISTPLLGAADASARSVALVIGNAAYEKTGPLRNPLNDAATVILRLEALGFEVQSVNDADRRTMGRAIKEFGRTARGADTALVFYSGHGMEIGGRNYLIPIDAELTHPDDAALEAIDLDAAIAAAGGASRLSVVIIDACRNNAFPSSTRSTAKGFAPVSARPGQAIAFSTAPGAVAYDGTGDLSPYTRALAEALEDTPGEDVRILLTSLGEATGRYAGAEQRPFTRFGDMPRGRVALAARRDETTSGTQAPERTTPVDDPAKAFAEGASTAALEAAAAIEAAADAPSVAADLSVDRFRDCAECPDMMVLPPRGPSRIAMAVYETTRGEWTACVDAGFCDPAPLSSAVVSGVLADDSKLPVAGLARIQIEGAKGFIAWLNRQVEGEPYRLPTSAEWTYAAQAGATTAYPWGGAPRRDRANYGAEVCCSGVAEGADRWIDEAPVGSFPANAYGLHDLNGNVWEWVADCEQWVSGACRVGVLRGGSYDAGGAGVANDSRAVFPIDQTFANIGFRVVRDMP